MYRDWSRNTLRLAALAAILAVVGGCSQPLATMMVSAPNRINPYVTDSNPIPPIESIAGVDQQFRVPVGPPDATLSVSVIEPKTDAPEPKGTILVIHGIYARSLWMMGPAKTLAEAGYRTVLVDLRGHGRSTGEFLTFGIQEAADLSQVIDSLEQRGLIAGKLGVYGISYGATTSIHLAGRDPRVQAVVAVAPFSTMRDEVPQFARDGSRRGLGDSSGDLPACHRGGGTPGRVRSGSGQRRRSDPADPSPSVAGPRHERLDRAAPQQRSFARSGPGSQPVGIDTMDRPHRDLGRSDQPRRPIDGRLVRSLAGSPLK